MFWPSKIEILRCLETNREGGGGGGVEFDTILSICFCILEKKNHRDIFQHKKSRHAKFQPMRSNLENHYDIVIWGWLAWGYSISIDLSVDFLIIDSHGLYSILYAWYNSLVMLPGDTTEATRGSSIEKTERGTVSKELMAQYI